MPNRIIKESICRSDTVNELSWFEEILFYRLIVNCDDYGRFDARTAIIKGSLFPLKSVTEKQIQDALNKLSTVGIVYLYEVDGKPYLQFVTWENHQQIRSKRSKFPAYDSTCNQMISDDSKCPRNPIQSESNPNPNPNPNSATAELFERFWNVYPRHVAKVDAEKAFKKLKADDALVDKIVNAVDQQKKSSQWQEEGGKFIPYPATWLNKAKWNDELDIKLDKAKKKTSFDLGEYGDMVDSFVPVYGANDERG